MANGFKIWTLGSSLLFLTAIAIYIFFPSDALLSVCITFGTMAYHFLMRLTVGGIINGIFHNRMKYDRWWFKERRFEKRLYKLLNFKKLMKHNIPTYSPDTFSTKKHSFEEIAQATCQAEIVHEIIILLSFAPVLFSHILGAFWVFLITSLMASLIDLFFVLVQRYKRPIIVRFLSRRK